MRGFVILAWIGMASVGSIANAAFIPAHDAYLAAAVLPVVAAALWQGSYASIAFAAMALAYAGVAMAAARGANRATAGMVRLQLRNEALLDDLQHAKAAAEAAREAALRAKGAAEEASRVKSHFLANMSHELRTPLNAIIGFSEVIEKQLFGPIANERYAQYIADIRTSGQHLLRLVDEVLDLSKLEAGTLSLAEELVDLATLIADCCNFVRLQAQQQGVTLHLDLPPDLPSLAADELRVKQILLNLLANAVKFTPSGGEVRVTASVRPNGELAIAVADTGIGMRPDDVAVALQPFQQLEGSLSRRYAGAGLGLPLAKTLVERHGGTLAVRTAPGRGTAIEVVMPAARTRPEDARRAAAATLVQ
jgi:signal transduction histidine kinase